MLFWILRTINLQTKCFVPFSSTWECCTDCLKRIPFFKCPWTSQLHDAGCSPQKLTGFCLFITCQQERRQSCREFQCALNARFRCVGRPGMQVLVRRQFFFFVRTTFQTHLEPDVGVANTSRSSVGMPRAAESFLFVDKPAHSDAQFEENKPLRVGGVIFSPAFAASSRAHCHHSRENRQLLGLQRSSRWPVRTFCTFGRFVHCSGSLEAQGYLDSSTGLVRVCVTEVCYCMNVGVMDEFRSTPHQPSLQCVLDVFPSLVRLGVLGTGLGYLMMSNVVFSSFGRYLSVIFACGWRGFSG